MSGPSVADRPRNYPASETASFPPPIVGEFFLPRF